jgi:ribosomal protein L11 methyltransferase
MPAVRNPRETLRLRVRAATAAEAEIGAADAWEAGAAGLVEDDEGRELTIYVPAMAADAVERALRASAAELDVAAPEPVEDIVWSEAWKQVLQPVEVSPRLGIAPPFATPDARPGQRWLRIEPGQAFGTGAHHSTRLALEALDAVLLRGPVRSVLDVGTGSGVLALAALALGAEWAVGLDLDPLAAPAARAGARANGLVDRAAWLTGPIGALAPMPFELVVVNLLKVELLPLAQPIAERVAADGHLVLAGLLEDDAPAIGRVFAPAGLREVERRTRRDEDGEVWLGLVLRYG